MTTHPTTGPEAVRQDCPAAPFMPLFFCRFPPIFLAMSSHICDCVVRRKAPRRPPAQEAPT